VNYSWCEPLEFFFSDLGRKRVGCMNDAMKCLTTWLRKYLTLLNPVASFGGKGENDALQLSGLYQEMDPNKACHFRNVMSSR